MTAQEFIHTLTNKGARLWLDGDQVRLQCQKSWVTGTLRETMSRLKPELITLLRTAPQLGEPRVCEPAENAPETQAHRHASIDFSVFYFANDGGSYDPRNYRLLIEGARIADATGLKAVWIPERHFHPFGGLYPNPSVLAAALSMVTKTIRIRAGSVVLPLHHPVRVAEEWSVVDNLSQGRVDIAFARGWNADDFVLSPDTYDDRTGTLMNGIDIIDRLWRGDSVRLPNGEGNITAVKMFPVPCQPVLPKWITSTGSRERFVAAGATGANLLTHLQFQSPDDLGVNIAAYRHARQDHGHDPDAGVVTVMVHLFLGATCEAVRGIVETPFKAYLRSSVNLWCPSVKELRDLSEHDTEDLVDYAFERYYHTNTLFGTPDSCRGLVARLHQCGVDEIACLIDFGVADDLVLDSLGRVCELNELAAGSYPGERTAP